MCILNYNIGYLQAGKVEGFAGRNHCNAVAVTQRGHGRVDMWCKDYLTVYLIAYQGHIVLAAQFVNAAQVLGGPYAAAWIVGITQHHGRALGIGKGFLQRLEVHLV